MDMPMIDNKPMQLTLTPRVISGNDVLFTDHLSKSFDDALLFENMCMSIKKGDNHRYLNTTHTFLSLSAAIFSAI